MKIGIVGAGTMGNGIAHVFSLHNNEVVICDLSDKILKDAINTIKKNMHRQYKKDAISQEQMNTALKNIHISNNLNELHDCDLIIEAVKEDFEVKSKVFKNLDSVCIEKTVFASNTSSISINKLAEQTSRKEKFIGMHFMNPVPIMKLVEVIKGSHTSNETVDFIMTLTKDIEKIPIKCNDAPGFVSNRILMPMINEAAYCFMDGVAEVKAIDSIMKLGMGHPMGPLKLADLIGIDVCVYIMDILFEGFNDKKYKPCPLLIDMVKNNKLGKKTKKGFYNYEF